MKTWKKMIGATALTGVAIGALAYFAKKKSLEDNFSEEFDDTFEDFDEELANKESDNKTASPKDADRDYVPIDLENEQKETKDETEEAKKEIQDAKDADNEQTEKKGEEKA